jgi:hypothetical protein
MMKAEAGDDGDTKGRNAISDIKIAAMTININDSGLARK